MAGTSVAVKTVLIADDDPLVRDRFRAAIEQSGHRAIAAASAADVIAHLRSKRAGVDLLVLDLQLPRSHGVDLVRTLRRSTTRQLPIVVFSGSIAAAEQVRELAALGVSAYINEFSAVQHIMPALAPHLFPDSFNRRTGPRVALGIAVQYRFGRTLAAASTLNLSRGGMAIRTTTPLDPGAKIRVRFRLPGAAHDIDADGRVVWQDRRVGMGVQFETVEPAHQALIDQFVDRLTTDR